MPLSAAASQDAWRRLTQLLTRKRVSYVAISVLALGCDVALYSWNVANGQNHTFAAALGYVAGLIVHFILSRRVVFQSTADGQAGITEALGFILSGFVGLAITACAMFVSTEILDLGTLVAKAVAVALSFVGVYLLRSRIIFKEATK
jgi:putative flippase GtrA